MAYAVNNDGDIVGTFISGGVESGFVYTGGVFQTIFCPGASYTVAQGINDKGVVVGYCDPNMYTGFVYQNGTYSYIKHPQPGATYLMGINNQGVMVGIWQKRDGGFQRSFVYSNGTFSTINGMRLPGGINNSNTVTGIACNNKTDVCHGAIYFQGENGWKSHKDVNYPGAASTLLGGINDNSEVVGYTEQPQDFVYNISSKTFTGFEVGNSVQSQAEGINNSGEIVGWYYDGTTTYGFYGQLSQ
jgi:uncharacterized membrane protein